MPPTLSEANISLLLKKDKDPLECSNYRPISLLNVDQKILAKVLASRLQQALSALISTDQTGFMAGRNSSSNTRRLLNIIGSPNPVLPEVVISLDAEKAFAGLSGSICTMSCLNLVLALTLLHGLDCFMNLQPPISLQTE